MSGLLGALTGGVSELLGPLVNRLVDLIPDPTEKAKMAADMQAKLLAADQAMEAQQSQINNTEAASTNVFVAGWRPGAGWVCVIALAWQVVLEPIGEWAATMRGYKGAFPKLDGSYITLILIPMMGLGVARTVEKMNNVPDSTPLQAKKR